MHGVTTALVAFIFFCVIFPERVKSRAQFYAGVGLICLIILLDALGFMISGTESKGFRVFAYFACAFLQVGAILMFFMSAGGLSWSELKDEMGSAYEVIRRGGEEKEVIIPLSGKKAARPDRPNDVLDDDESPGVIRIDTPPESPGGARPRPASPNDASIPLD